VLEELDVLDVLDVVLLSGSNVPPAWPPFLWPMCEDSEDSALPTAVGMLSMDMEISYWRYGPVAGIPTAATCRPSG
jgi:hypothetical protein